MDKETKIDRKELKRPDRFLQWGQAFFAALGQRRRRFVPVLIAGAVLVAGGYAFEWWSEQRLEKAWTEYNRIQKLTGTERDDQLKQFHGSHGDSRPGLLAAVGLGDRFFDQARTEALKKDGTPQEPATQALAWYGKALEFNGLLQQEKQLLYMNRAGAQELLEKWTEAKADYQLAVEYGGDMAGWALVNVGRLEERLGDKAKAEEAYKKVVADHGNTEYGRMAKNLLRRLTSPLWSEGQSE